MSVCLWVCDKNHGHHNVFGAGLQARPGPAPHRESSNGRIVSHVLFGPGWGIPY
jgi:hypothetical protein